MLHTKVNQPHDTPSWDLLDPVEGAECDFDERKPGSECDRKVSAVDFYNFKGFLDAENIFSGTKEDFLEGKCGVRWSIPQQWS